VLFSSWLISPARAQEAKPEVTVWSFYAWVLAHPMRAMPPARERAQLAKLLAPKLVQLLDDAAATEARCVKSAAKGEKPDLLEGDLFVGNYEGASEVAYGEARRDGDAMSVEANLTYVDKRYAKAHPLRAVAWRDRLELGLAGGRWLIEDIKFPENRSFAAGLAEYIENGRKNCNPGQAAAAKSP
jgi:hypothetical protein